MNGESAKAVALVTGASSGKGEAPALRLAEAGYPMVGKGRKGALASSLPLEILPLKVTSDAQAQDIFDAKLIGIVRMSHAVVPHMRRQGGGRIFNSGSVVGLMAMPWLVNSAWGTRQTKRLRAGSGA